MSEKLKKYVIETASDNPEAVFILCTKRPWFRVKVHHFSTLKPLLEYQTTNPTLQVLKFPILLEVIEIEENYNKNQFRRSFNKMPFWYYYTQVLKIDEPKHRLSKDSSPAP